QLVLSRMPVVFREQTGEVGTPYGVDTGAWLHAAEARFGIFYPPIYIQDMPDRLWPGGVAYRFRVPVWWDADATGGAVVLRIENRITRWTGEDRFEWSDGISRSVLEVTCPVPAESKGLFKIVLFGDGTAQYTYRPVRFAVEPLPDRNLLQGGKKTIGY
ncbi:hypothetical protein JXA80_06455, partial [bacterium]|nr:hypothetical protein [candidate division CSSED10-310 bacterium]